jgi:hypothetical protein
MEVVDTADGSPFDRACEAVGGMFLFVLVSGKGTSRRRGFQKWKITGTFHHICFKASITEG